MSDLNPSLVVPMQDLLPVGDSLHYRYKCRTGCNEQRMKLRKFRKEILCRVFLVKSTKNALWVLLLKIFKSRLASFFPRRYRGSTKC